MSYFPSISQNVTVDTNNTYSNSTASLATYSPAAGSSTLGVNAIQFTVTSTQNVEVYVDQGVDPTFATYDVRDTYQYNVIKGNFGITVQAIADYVRISVKNLSSTTATIVVHTVLCPIVETLPRSLGQDVTGPHLKVGVHELGDRWGNSIHASPAGWLDVNQPYRLCGAAFGSAIDSLFWNATFNVNGGSGGASGVANSIATISSGIGTNAWAQMSTLRQARFIFNNALKTKQLILIPTVVTANTNRYWGAMTMTVGSAGVLPTIIDGFYFALNGSGVLSVNSRNTGGTPNSVSSGSFNGESSTYVVDTNVHAYEIVYYVAKAQFYIDDVLIHTFRPTTTILTATCTLPIGILATTSSTNSGTIQMWAGTIHRLGRDISCPASYYHANGITGGTGVSLKLGAGNLISMTFQSLTNSVVTLSDSTSALTPILYASTGVAAITQPVTIMFNNLPFTNGLRLGVISANSQVTVVYE